MSQPASNIIEHSDENQTAMFVDRGGETFVDDIYPRDDESGALVIPSSVVTSATQRLGDHVYRDTAQVTTHEDMGVGGGTVGSVTVFGEGEFLTQFDSFRQGKNIKDLAHFSKIIHPLMSVNRSEIMTPKNRFNYSTQQIEYGQSQPYEVYDNRKRRFIPFEDFPGKLDPVAFIKAENYIMQYMIVTDLTKDLNQFVNPDSLDGAIEVFEIRESFANTSISDIMIKGFKGSMSNENIFEPGKGAAPIDNKYEIEQSQNSHYEDTQDVMYADQLFPQQLSLQNYPDGKADGDGAFGLKGFRYSLLSNMVSIHGSNFFGEQHPPYAWYQFDKDPNDTGTALDLSGNSRNLTPQDTSDDEISPSEYANGPGHTKSPPGFPIKSARFDHDVWDIADSGSAFSFGDGTNDSGFTISTWINPGADTRQYITSKYDSDDTSKREWILYLSTDGSGVRQPALLLYDADATKYAFTVNTGETLEEGRWYNFVAVYDGRGGADAADGIRLFIDGKEVDSYSRTTQTGYVAMENTAVNFHVGGEESDGASGFNGHIAEVALWSTALSDEAIAALYELKDTHGAEGSLGFFSLPGFVMDPSRIMAPFVESSAGISLKYKHHLRDFLGSSRPPQAASVLTGSLAIETHVPELGTRFKSSNCGFISTPNYSKLTGDSFADDVITSPGTDSIAFIGTSRS